jgi:hypothetical protein
VHRSYQLTYNYLTLTLLAVGVIRECITPYVGLQVLRYDGALGHSTGIAAARRAARSLMSGFTGCSANVTAVGTGRNAHLVVIKTATTHTALVNKHASQLQQIKQLKVLSLLVVVLLLLVNESDHMLCCSSCL